MHSSGAKFFALDFVDFKTLKLLSSNRGFTCFFDQLDTLFHFKIKLIIYNNYQF